MARYDVFNGDADGICALLQLRLAAPADSTLITGEARYRPAKQVVAAPGDEITVLDVSMDTNRAALDTALPPGPRSPTSIIISQERFAARESDGAHQHGCELLHEPPGQRDA